MNKKDCSRVAGLDGSHGQRHPQAWNDHILWGSVLIFLLTRGPGALSLDHLIERRLAKRD